MNYNSQTLDQADILIEIPNSSSVGSGVVYNNINIL